MAESVTFNNAVYIIPDVGESNWGQNLTNYFVAIPSGCYQLSGGTQPLTADLSFGSNYGLLSLYFKSVSSNIAGAGVIRLANSDTIDWRNAANNANLALSVDSSNNLLWNGDIISTSSSSPVLSITGTANQVIASSSTGNVTLSLPQSIATSSTPTFSKLSLGATTNQMAIGAASHVITISSTAPASSQTYTIPDAGGSANVVLDLGNYTIAGTWSFNNAVTAAGFYSGTANPATGGIIRLASTDGIYWRNNANSANIALTKNTSDQLLYSGAEIVDATGHLNLGSVTGDSGGWKWGHQQLNSFKQQLCDDFKRWKSGGAGHFDVWLSASVQWSQCAFLGIGYAYVFRLNTIWRDVCVYDNGHCFHRRWNC